MNKHYPSSLIEEYAFGAEALKETLKNNKYGLIKGTYLCVLYIYARVVTVILALAYILKRKN